MAPDGPARFTSPAILPACDPLLLRDIEQALEPLPQGAPVGIALSAGPDSAMLAIHAAHIAQVQGCMLHALHVHHGLQAEADAWLQHAHDLAGLLQISCHSRKVTVTVAGRGLEAAARTARYAALRDLAAGAGIGHILLAHHQDDQAETVLLRLLRGAGPEGLAAMAPVVQRHGLYWLRPWLNQPRTRVLACVPRFAAATRWHPVQDPSNQAVHLARGALRTELAPILDRHWPAWRTTLGRHAQQAQALQRWAAAAGAQALQTLDPDEDGGGFSLAAWRALSAEQQVAVLRHWLHAQGLRMPTAARLRDWLHQLRTVHALGHDRQVTLPHEGHVIRVVRGRVRLFDSR
ncbi:tRNA lysidine(34) synthetase TilS [Castellaniella sp.]|uniref:tRNA lysidine(34) synthetase TilS n=1 Tax=Castellaniella sp. TaxID=1955812 RepID=UPI00355E17DE